MIKIDGVEDIKKLLHGEHAEQQKVTVGFIPDTEKQTESRKIGDRWFDADGNEWEQKEGYTVKLGKEWQQELQTYLKSFPNCRKETCTCSIPKRLDEKMRRIHGMCFDCVIDMEHKIRLQGKWDEYERMKIKENALAWLKEAEKDKDAIAEELSKLDFANEFGDSEKWTVNISKEDLLKKIEAEFEEFKRDFIDKLDNVNTDATDEKIMFGHTVDVDDDKIITMKIIEKGDAC
jgi:hypothetical protein